MLWSRYIDPLPELDPMMIGTKIFVSIEDLGPGNLYPTWKDLLDSGADEIVLMPGDYVAADIPVGGGAIGTSHLEFGATQDGIPGRRRVLRGFGDEPQWMYPSYLRTRIPGFQFGTFQGAASAYWIVHNVAMTGGTIWENSIRNRSHHIVVDQLFLQDHINAYGVRFLLGAHDCVIQRFVMLDPGAFTDGVAVQWKAPNQAQQAAGFGPMHNLRVLSGVVRNYNDAFAISVTQDTESNQEDGLLFDDGIVDDCDFFATSAIRTDGSGVPGSGDAYMIGENAMDIKGGAADPARAVLFSNLRMHGYRYFDASGGPSGSDGAAITIHVKAKRLIFKHIYIWDCPVGIRVSSWLPANAPQPDREIVIEDAVFSGLTRYAPEDRGGIAIVSRMPLTLRRVAFVDCENGINDLTPLLPGYDLSIDKSAVVDTPLGTASGPWALGDNRTRVRSRVPDLRVKVNRIFDPELVVLPNSAALLSRPVNAASITTQNTRATIMADSPAQTIQVQAP